MCLAALMVGVWYLLLKRKKARRWWVKPINANRKNQADYHNLIQEMRVSDPDMFFNYTKLAVDQFDLLLTWIGPVIKKDSFRESINPGARLVLTPSEVNGQLVLGEWRDDIPADTALRPVAKLRRRIGTRNSPQRAIAYRNYPKMYVNGEIGSVPWQYNAINK
ncbi:hypothetical protein ILUMI_15679 [Ignelater luminosus]|uniref:Uncharacterized protein n=1 Tax=Ignelater luminosus TaxID=2038154 RepID=A0A8K0CQ01_IGNLU|nr:hypothetical protein ILUMI_15679 [Ignelater luminosus]